MISSLVLLSTSLLVSSVTILDVTASREAGHLRVDVRGDGGIDPEGARTMIDDGRLLIYLGGTRVRADKRSWALEGGDGEIRAHRHKLETELVVPLAGNGCDGPVELSGSDSGITALVGCDGAVVSSHVNRPEVVANRVTKATKAERTLPKLKELVELPPEPAVGAEPLGAAEPTKAHREAAAAAMPAKAAVVVVAPPPPTPVVPARVSAAKTPAAPVPAPPVATAPTSKPFPTLALAASASAPAPGEPAQVVGKASEGSSRAVTMPALLLAALAVLAYWLSRRKRGALPRHIQILETTTLGPKRALICARIGDEMVILGSSEAGITLLRGGAGPGVPSSAQAAWPSSAPDAVAASLPQSSVEVADENIEIDQPLEEALADIPEPGDGSVGGQVRNGFRTIEGGLAGLFGKRPAGGGKDAPAANRFEDLLEDSVEDQELRRKLAAGMSARVR